MIAHQQIYGKKFFTDEATISRDGITNTRYSNKLALKNTIETKEFYFQLY